MFHPDRISRALVIVGSAGLMLLATRPLCAQGKDPVAATELFTQGRDYLQQGDLDKACALFAESLRLDPAVGTALNLAECEQRRGRLAMALRQWQQAINLAKATNDERLEVAMERHAALEPRVPKLTVRLEPGAPDGVVVMREDVELGRASLGRALPVDPGRHVIVVTAPGHEDSRQTVLLREGEDKKVMVRVGEPTKGSKPVAVKPARPVESERDRTLAYVLGGVGAAGLLAGTVTGVMLMNERKKVDEHCDDRDRCDATGLAAADAGKKLVPINTVAWVVGVAGLGAGAYFYFTAPPSDASSVASPSGAYVQVRGTF